LKHREDRPFASDLAIVRRQYFELVGSNLDTRRTNLPVNRHAREDDAFHPLSERAFNNPTFLEKVTRMSAQWLARCPCETTRAVAAYVAYLREDYARAATLMLSCITENPENLDNWVDLAFALNHQAHPLGRHILFNHTEYITRFMASGSRIATMARLEALRNEIDSEGCDYGRIWQQVVGPPPEISPPPSPVSEQS
jgi:hypothetical protein